MCKLQTTDPSQTGLGARGAPPEAARAGEEGPRDQSESLASDAEQILPRPLQHARRGEGMLIEDFRCQ